MESSGYNEGDILEAALDEAFMVPPTRETVKPEVARSIPKDSGPKAETETEPAVTAEPSPIAEATGFDESWKEEYEMQVQNWRAQSAEAREKAEKERSKWEAIRVTEKEEAAKQKATRIVDEPAWGKVGAPSISVPTAATSSKPSDLLDHSNHPALTEHEPSVDISRTLSRQDTTTDESQKWEEVPSDTSSFPSMTFPEQAHTPPPAPPTQPPASNPPLSVTLAMFDTSLSTRTRVTALVSSLAVNLLLPFVNGVMLGFGEIFAKNVVMDFLGWKGHASVVANVGLRNSPRVSRQSQSTPR